MPTRFRWPSRLPAVLLLMLCLPGPTAAQTQESFKNLKVLPPDITREQLNQVMLGNLLGLGLPRRQNEGCLHCHVGNMEQPVDTWDFASDDKLTKRKARVMMAMVRSINAGHLPTLEERITPQVEVTCYTCHAGRLDPRPLTTVLWSTYETGGIDSAIAQYRRLRARYYEADAYDFRVPTLARLAEGMARSGEFADAIALAGVNLETHSEDADAQTHLWHLGLARTVQEQGIAAAMEEFDAVLVGNPGGVSWDLLDGLGWGLFRQGQQESAFVVFRKNLATFPDEYIPNESMADGLYFGEPKDVAGAIAIFEAWLERHPDHAMARRRLTNIRQ